LPSALVKVLLGWSDEVIDEALHHGVVCPRWRLMQVDVEVWRKKANGAAMKSPQVIDNQALIAAEIVLATGWQ
jgi:hypothetical protein